MLCLSWVYQVLNQIYVDAFFKRFANVSKPNEEDLKPTCQTFQLLGPDTAKDLVPGSNPSVDSVVQQYLHEQQILKLTDPSTKELLMQ